MKDWEYFFQESGRDLLATDAGGTVGVEDLYRAFKARMIAELGVQTHHMDGPRRSGQLFDRAPTGGELPK